MIRALVAIYAILAMFAALPAYAHRIAAAGGPPPDGIAIPSLTHGQMAVIADNLPSIRKLAAGRIGTDMTTWRLEDYLNLQSFACLLGLAPGSITDESSPFNECSHAYLAAGRALLLQLRDTPGVDRSAVEALVGKVETEMLAEGASLTLCRYSDEPFNTNEIIWPHWSEIPFHAPSLLTFAAIASLLAGATVLPMRRAGQ